jgi:endonuclease/exonuclease/phosphatase family metal-dependent hydrolase
MIDTALVEAGVVTRMWRHRLGVAATWTGPVAIGCWTVIRLAGWDSHYPIVQLMAFTPYVAGAAVLLAVALWAVRQWWPAGVATALAFVLAVIVTPRALRDHDASAAAHGPVIRVATANIFVGTADPRGVVKTVQQLHVDVLALQEMTADWLARADAAGLGVALPYRVAVPAPGAEGSGIFSRYPVEAAGHRDEWFIEAVGVIRLPTGTAVHIESVHAASPFDRANTPHWLTSLRREPRADLKAATPRVLLGDFNATLDHHELRDLIDSGYRDAASVAGAGWTGTWGPYDGDPIPPVIIDHVLADRRIGVKGVYVVAVPGSDHRMVVADLVLP